MSGEGISAPFIRFPIGTSLRIGDETHEQNPRHQQRGADRVTNERC